MYCLIPFDCECEECHKSFDGVFWRLVPEEETSPLAEVMSSGMKSLAHSVDAANARKGMEKKLRNKEWAGLSSGGHYAGVSYGEIPGHKCPHCGARQSWDTMDEPKEPQKGGGGMMGCSVIVCGMGGSLLGCVLMVVMPYGILDEITWVFVGILIGALIGVVLGRFMNKQDDAEARESYPERLAAYERDLAAYNAYVESVSRRTTRNEPVPDYDSCCFAPQIVFRRSFGRYQPGHCPACGGKLEGYAPVGSQQVARARANCCPWCGAALPAGIRMKVGS